MLFYFSYTKHILAYTVRVCVCIFQACFSNIAKLTLLLVRLQHTNYFCKLIQFKERDTSKNYLEN